MKLTRMWLCRDRSPHGYYALYVGKRPAKLSRDDGMWHGSSAVFCVAEFEATHSFRLALGEGPVEVMPMRLKKARKR